MEFSEHRRDGIWVLVLKGRLDSNTCGEFEVKLLGLAQAGETKLVLDCTQLNYISSAGLRVLLKAAKAFKAGKGQMRLCGLKGSIREILEMSGFVFILPISATQGEAVKHLTSGA